MTKKEIKISQMTLNIYPISKLSNEAFNNM